MHMGHFMSIFCSDVTVASWAHQTPKAIFCLAWLETNRLNEIMRKKKRDFLVTSHFDLHFPSSNPQFSDFNRNFLWKITISRACETTRKQHISVGFASPAGRDLRVGDRVALQITEVGHLEDTTVQVYWLVVVFFLVTTSPTKEMMVKWDFLVTTRWFFSPYIGWL